jgi:hypothetical protein
MAQHGHALEAQPGSAPLANMERGANQHSPIGETSQARAAEMLNVGKRTVERAAVMASSARKKGPPAFGGPSLGRNALRSKAPLEPVTSKNGKRLFPAVFTQKENGCGIVSSEPRR